MQQRQPYPPGSAMSLGNAGAFSSSSLSSSAVAAATMADVATHRANGEPIPMSEQLMQVDQAITLTLQEIDANFARSHQTITGKILPAIRRYGIASHNTWQGARVSGARFRWDWCANVVYVSSGIASLKQPATSTLSRRTKMVTALRKTLRRRHSPRMTRMGRPTLRPRLPRPMKVVGAIMALVRTSAR